MNNPKIHFENTLVGLEAAAEHDIGMPFSWLESRIADPLLESLLFDRDRIEPLAKILRVYFHILKNDLVRAGADIAKLDDPDDLCGYCGLVRGLFHFAARQYRRAARELVAVVNSHKNSFFVWQKMLMLCLRSGEHSQGADWFDHAIVLPVWKAQTRINLLELGSTLHVLRYDFDRSIELSRELLSLRLDMPFPKPSRGDDARLEMPGGWKTLIDILDLLESRKLQPFPTAGTLLGWQREGDLLPFDKDLDLAFMPGDSLDLVRFVLAEHPRYEQDAMALNCPSYMSVKDKTTGCTLDFLQLWENKGHLEYGWRLPGIYRAQSRVLTFSRFELVRDEWKGRPMWRPNNADAFLAGLYGNWMEPDRYFDSCGGCPNLVGMTSLVRAMVYNQIVTALARRRYEKALAGLNSLIHHGEPHGVAKDLQHRLKEHLGYEG